jgi:hypothetical protein
MHLHQGYMASGDLGYLDDAGRLLIVGRDDEIIVSGGLNVYPIEVEKPSPPIPTWRTPAKILRTELRVGARGVSDKDKAAINRLRWPGPSPYRQMSDRRRSRRPAGFRRKHESSRPSLHAHR